MGAYLQLVTRDPVLGAWIYAGPYAIPNYSVEFTGVFTNTTPTDAYRGAGRPEATYVIERTMDDLADELGMDRLELRRKNFIAEFPFTTLASGLTVDSGDYHASLDKLLEVLDLDASGPSRPSAVENGVAKQLGVGFSTYNEMCGLAPSRILGAIRYAAAPPPRSMKPSFLNLFRKKFTRERVVPIISASVSCEIFGTTRTGLSCFP